jgi:hypothetical protein
MSPAHEIRVQREQETAGEVIANRHRPQEILAGAAFALCHRKRSRHDGAAGMCFRLRMKVIGLVGVGEHGIRQSRVDRRSPDIRSDDARLLDAALTARKTDRHLTGLEMSAGDHGSECVEDAMLRRLHHIQGKIPIPCRRHVLRQPSGDISTRHSTSFRHFSYRTA